MTKILLKGWEKSGSNSRCCISLTMPSVFVWFCRLHFFDSADCTSVFLWPFNVRYSKRASGMVGDLVGVARPKKKKPKPLLLSFASPPPLAACELAHHGMSWDTGASLDFQLYLFLYLYLLTSPLQVVTTTQHGVPWEKWNCVIETFCETVASSQHGLDNNDNEEGGGRGVFCVWLQVANAGWLPWLGGEHRTTTAPSSLSTYSFSASNQVDFRAIIFLHTSHLYFCAEDLLDHLHPIWMNEQYLGS